MKGLGKPSPKPEGDVIILRKYLEQFAQVAPLDGQPVSGVVATGQFYVLIRHSLGRSYQGAMLTGSSSGAVYVAQTPAAALAGGTDITRFVVFLGPIAATDTTLTAWVF